MSICSYNDNIEWYFQAMSTSQIDIEMTKEHLCIITTYSTPYSLVRTVANTHKYWVMLIDANDANNAHDVN